MTTISNGAFIKCYLRAALAYGNREAVRMYVVGDLNTPSQCYDVCSAMSSIGFECVYLDPERQRELLQGYGVLFDSIPWRSDNRRNLGYLAALRDGADIVISIDDDNVPLREESFLAQHSLTGEAWTGHLAASRCNWYNPAALLEMTQFDRGVEGVYARGYPHSARGNDQSSVSSAQATSRVMINAGLWTKDPDVDAATRLTQFPRARTSHSDSFGVMLPRGMRAPINTQNTAIIGEAVFAYYFAAMGDTLKYGRIDRFGDIFSGYFVQMCAEAVGGSVRVGGPFVEQTRNRHDLFLDLSRETSGMALIDRLSSAVEEPLAPTTSWAEAYSELAIRVSRWASDLHREGDELAAMYLRRLSGIMELWVDACSSLSRRRGQ